jgi:nitrogen fixation/metabolism regulation signal transduction histidine kinase
MFIQIQVKHKVFPWLHLLQENYVEYNFFFQNVTQIQNFFYNTLVHFNMFVCLYST